MFLGLPIDYTKSMKVNTAAAVELLVQGPVA